MTGLQLLQSWTVDKSLQIFKRRSANDDIWDVRYNQCSHNLIKNLFLFMPINKLPNTSPLTDKDSAIFRTVAGAGHPPGTIVADFDRLLAVLEKEGIPLSPKTREFGIASLPVLNAQLSEPAAIGLARGRQTSYPQLDGLHLLLRLTRICRLDTSTSTTRLMLDPEMGARWAALNSTERYFSLLDALWNPADEFNQLALLQSADYRLRLLESHRPKSKKVQDMRQNDALFHLLGMNHVALLQMFGMLEIKQETATPGTGWKIAQLQATPWGLAACRSFWTACKQTNRWLCDMQDDPESEKIVIPDGTTSFDYWAAAVKPYFPDWTQTFDGQKNLMTFSGSITFKVSLGDVWRRIVMSGEHDFAELASVILNAFDFDEDHLYQFDYMDEYGERRSLEDDRCEDVYDQYANDVRLGEIGLHPKQVIDFRYDFGDDWRFKLVVEKLDPTQTDTIPSVIAQAGKAPRQY